MSRGRIPRPHVESTPGSEERAVHVAVLASFGVFVWILHGLLVAILTMPVLLALTGFTNMAILKMKGGLRLIRVSRWAWLVLAFAALAAIGHPAAERDCASAAPPLWRALQGMTCGRHADIASRPHLRHPHARALAAPGTSSLFSRSGGAQA